ncbi:hypothetical protein JKP88DRAFT_261875 [Tribonema minus]|uniref:Chalcone isomerase domain-containing protein n=1 Tax=Tribonema minus TaxID=303371 RepID=A0A835ZC45_9STRA|nr:hypothetical protein JKP88DRAFT_261875 [Tribonema minus]
MPDDEDASAAADVSVDVRDLAAAAQELLAGPRVRQRTNFLEPEAPVKETLLLHGKGERLGHIENVSAAIDARKRDDDVLKKLHTIAFGRAGKATEAGVTRCKHDDGNALKKLHPIAFGRAGKATEYVRRRASHGVTLQIGACKHDNDGLKKLHTIAFGRAGKATEVKANLKQFSGLVYTGDAAKERERYTARIGKWMLSTLKDCMDLLDIPRGIHAFPELDGKSPPKEKLVERLVEWLENPQPSGKKRKAPKAAKKGAKKKAAGGGKPGKKAGAKGDKRKAAVVPTGGDSTEEEEGGEEEEEEGEEGGQETRSARTSTMPDTIVEPVTGIALAATASFGGSAQLRCVGAGARVKSVALASVKVYALALYVEPGGAARALARYEGVAPAERARDVGFYEELMKPAAFPSYLVMSFARNVGTPKVVEALTSAVQGVAPDVLKNFAGMLGAAMGPSMRKGDVVAMGWEGEGRLAVVVRGVRVGEVADAVLPGAIFKVNFDTSTVHFLAVRLYLGSDPVSPPAKAAFASGVSAIYC